MSANPAFTWTSGSLSNVGNVRAINEDSCLELPRHGLWVVADGMGGHAAGDVASQMIVESLRGIGSYDRPSAFVDDVEGHLLEVNRRLYEKSIEGDEPTTIGSTVAAVLAFDSHAVSIWAGDSRVYRLRDGSLLQITRDHSQVEELIDQGVLTPETAESHPSANVITRAVGGSETLYLDLVLHRLRDGDRYLVCSDGLFKDVTELEISAILQEGTCDEACRNLIRLALERECSDNVTVVVVQFDERHQPPES